MFTGLVEGVGLLRARTPRGGDARLRIDAGSLPWGAQAGIAAGESIAVNGVCLTVVEFDDAGFQADASNETLSLTTLGALEPGRPLNLERALRADARLGGHLVSGHVDGTGRVLSIAPDGRAQRWRFAAPARLMRYLAAKGSVCVDGVSLTVNAVEDAAADAGGDDGAFEAALVPHTIACTAFAATRVGDPVNLEVDQLARYAERLLAARGAREA
ncbi:MAG: riboflavin synthase [Gammaproteobacteria bacterium]